MDKEEFRKRLEEVAVLQDVKPARTASTGRLPKEVVVEVDEYGEEVEVERTIPLENDTLGFKMVKVKPIAKICDLGCGKIVEDQVIEQRLSIYPTPHWRTRCVKCNAWLAPNGVDIIHGSPAAQSAFVKHLKSKE